MDYVYSLQVSLSETYANAADSPIVYCREQSPTSEAVSILHMCILHIVQMLYPQLDLDDA